MADRVIQRNDTAANWQSVNPVLATGEIGIVIDGAKGYKIGDGVTRWNDLPYPANPTNVVQELGDNEYVVISQKGVTNKLSELDSEVKLNSIAIGKTEFLPIILSSSNSFKVTTKPLSVPNGNYTFGFRLNEVADREIYIAIRDSLGNKLLNTNISKDVLTNEWNVAVTKSPITITYAQYGEDRKDVTITTSIDYDKNIHNEIEDLHLEQSNDKESLSSLEYRLGKAYLPSTEIEVKIGKYIDYERGIEVEYAQGVYTDYIEFIPTNRYNYIGDYGFGISPISYYDKDKKFISSYSTNYESSIINIDYVVSNIPSNTAFIRFSGYEEAKVTVKSLEDFLSDNNRNVSELRSRLDVVEKETDLSNTTAVVFDNGYIDINGKLAEYVDGKYSDYYEINGKVFDYKGTTQYRATCYVFYDENKSKISSYPDTNQSTRLYVDVKSVAPPSNAKYVRFSGLYEDFSAVIYSNGNLRKEIDLINEELNKLQYKGENKLYGKSVIWVGDSITEGSVRMSPPFGGWAKIIADKNTMKSTNYGIGGTCITHIEGKTNAIVDRLQNYSKDVDYCIVQGGLNDTAQAGEILGEITNGYTAQLNTSTYCGAMEFICKYLATNYSGKKYGFIVTFQIASTKWNTTWGDKTVEILKKWGIPYIDLRYCAGFNLASPDMRKLFGTYIGDVALYDSTKGYVLDEQVKYNGALYKANVDIPSPSGEFDASKWTLQESDNASDYDNWHCNITGYKMIADKIEAWMRTL